MYVQSNLYFLHRVLCAADFSGKTKIAPDKQGRLNRGTTLLLRTLANADSKAEKSSRGNGRSVVPTIGSAHSSQKELPTARVIVLHPPTTLCGTAPCYFILLKRFWIMCISYHHIHAMSRGFEKIIQLF